jgi:hypothetical protein
VLYCIKSKYVKALRTPSLLGVVRAESWPLSEALLHCSWLMFDIWVVLWDAWRL